MKIDDVVVHFASPEDLIIHKIIAGRPRDLEDIRNILVKNPGIDRDYILYWLNEFELSLNQPFKQRFEKLWEETQSKAEE